MEIINGNQIPEQPRKRYDRSLSGNLYLGAMLILVGLLWLFHNIGIVNNWVFDMLFSWQMLLIVIGGYFLATRRWATGAIIGGLGLIFFIMNAFDIYISVSKIILPSVVIAIGLSILLSYRQRN